MNTSYRFGVEEKFFLANASHAARLARPIEVRLAVIDRLVAAMKACDATGRQPVTGHSGRKHR